MSRSSRRRRSVGLPKPRPAASPTCAPPKATFTGRAGELAEIRTELLRRADGVGIPVVVVHGLGGVGKTELARQYAQTYRHSYDLAWWSPAPG
ncbi:AAA family ATPase [Streptomyces sp. NPDC056628]|uniref:AAA family ATPase n=1 Tax=Streptomyces sp. NPDC056628 TaxID=3345882 RepID=UPI0036C5F638